MEDQQQLYCECCEKPIKKGRAVWLELSITDGEFHKEIPKGHMSQGMFSFGSTCAKKELKK